MHNTALYLTLQKVRLAIQGMHVPGPESAYVAMALKQPTYVSFVGEGGAAGVPQHVAACFEARRTSRMIRRGTPHVVAARKQKHPNGLAG